MNQRPFPRREAPQAGPKDPTSPACDLRHEAEARIARLLGRPSGVADTESMERLVHELGVHQIEIEMQNEELRQAQAALEASRDRYVNLYEQAPVGYVTFDLDSVVVTANRLAAALAAVPQSEMAGRRLTDFVFMEDRPRFQQHMARLVRGDGQQLLELRLAQRQDEARWVTLQMTLVPDEKGRPQCRAALIDISGRVRMQEGVARLAAIVSSSEDAIISRDLAGVITSWNGAAGRMFGRDDLLGHTMDRLVPANRRAEEADLLQRLRNGEKIAHFESERIGRGGVLLPISLSLSPIRDERGRVIGSALIARDISERRRADRALHQRLRQLDVLSHAGQALIMGDHGGASLRRELFERVRAAIGCEIHLDYGVGETPDRLVLLNSHGLSDMQRADMAQVGDSLCSVAAQQRSHLVMSHLAATDWPPARRIKAVGALCYAGFPLLTQGRVYGVAAFASTTRDRFAESDLQVMQTVCDQVSAMLERSRLLEELHVSEQSLKRADRAKDDFIATLAHELRNPLAPIRNALGVMRRGNLGDQGQQGWCRDVIERQVTQMSRLLEDLLDVSRLTRNKVELRRDRIELRQAIDQALETTQPLIESQGHRLLLDLPEQPIVLHGDLMRLTQVFANLLNNAAKYTDAGGEIALQVRAEGDRVRVSVRDNGIGIEAQQLPRVFDMFAQLVPALDRSAGGLGIGLALSRGLVELHGGTMEARSAGIGRGSEFVVHLPIVPAAEPADAVPAAQPAAPTLPALPQRRLLVADDNVDAASSLAVLLSLHGQEVRTAFGGLEALRVAEEWHPDAAVLDIGMQDMNGYELCRRLRAQSWGPKLLLIACTGWGQDTDRELAREAGFDHHMVKPVDPEAMLRLLSMPPPR